MFGGRSEQNLICLLFALVFFGFLRGVLAPALSLHLDGVCTPSLDSLQVGQCRIVDPFSLWISLALVGGVCFLDIMPEYTLYSWHRYPLITVFSSGINCQMFFRFNGLGMTFPATCLRCAPTSPTCHCVLFGSAVVGLPVFFNFPLFIQ